MQLNELIHTLTQSTDLPLLTAFILGILTALNPCQLAISISAVAYLQRNSSAKGLSTLLYPLGRTITYTMLAWTLMCLIGGSKNLKGAEHIFALTEQVLPYLLIVIGLFLLTRSFLHHHHHDDSCHNSGQLIRRNGPLGSLILGIVLALAFCPESAIFYFGIMLPMAVTSTVGIIVPIAFALGAALPVLAMALLMHFAVSKVERATHTLEHFQNTLNIITGILFIIIATLLLLAP